MLELSTVLAQWKMSFFVEQENYRRLVEVPLKTKSRIF